jgi:hypothetical protein
MLETTRGAIESACQAALERWVPPDVPLARFALFALAALVGSTALAAFSMLYETAAFAGYTFLECNGLIERLVPSKPATVRAAARRDLHSQCSGRGVATATQQPALLCWEQRERSSMPAPMPVVYQGGRGAWCGSITGGGRVCVAQAPA